MGVQVVQIGRVCDAQLTFGAFVQLSDHLRACGSKKWCDNPHRLSPRAHRSAAGPHCSPGSLWPHLRAPHGSTQTPRVAELQDSTGQVRVCACVRVRVCACHNGFL